MIESVRAAFSLPDLRRRITFTVIMLVIYRLIANIPVPGVNLAAWLQFTSQQSGNQVIDFLDLLSGGAVRNFSVMAMGVYPYITASIIMQLLQPIIPQLEELASEGESGRDKINRITYYLSVPLTFLQAIAQVRLIGISIGGGTSDGLATIMPNFGFGAAQLLPTATTLFAMTGGTMFAIWIGNRITEEGIGQGISLIIFGGIISRILPNTARLFAIDDMTARIFTVLAFLTITVATVLVIVVIQEGQRRIPVQYGRRVRGRKVYQGQSTFVPLKVNTAGMIPIIFAQSILTFPPLIANFFVGDMSVEGNFFQNIARTVSGFGNNTLTPESASFYIYWIVYFLFVVGFTFFYTDVMVQQQNLPQTLQRQGGFIPGIRPGKRTADYITAVVRRITLVGALFLGLVAILPGIMALLGNLLRIQGLEQSVLIISGSGLIIVVGVVIDTMRQLEAQLLMRNYEGFIK
ncbi:MAG: preprotein translocase subunit SecY [Ardenticatenaceae bacterium]|nr:preprotein translocase subunit SecY [Anaerolineales bacterium]MCB8922584.1 preprotein translocase subunit SecY [Ardenticatenaceae bacterium]MCB8991252.1 preprotein translocase subunit SecY [Ardenticatenaceae bacterium]MCB9003707.1 preprotein translocase subunit SecY [Ardenticatenaceae bacterium]